MSNSTHRFKFAISSTHTYVEYCYQAKFSFFLKFKKNLKLLWWMNFHFKFRGSFKKYTQKKSVWNGENFRDNHTWSVQDNFHNCVKNGIFNNIHTCNICNINLKYTQFPVISCTILGKIITSTTFVFTLMFDKKHFSPTHCSLGFLSLRQTWAFMQV